MPAAIVEENYFNALISSIDAAATFATNSINLMLTNGSDLGPTANACLNESDGVQSGSVDQFTCIANPIVFNYSWGGGKYSGTGEAQFTRVSVSDNEAKSLVYGSAPLPSGIPGSNPFSAFVDYDAEGLIVLSNGISSTSDSQTKPASCSINVSTRITQDNADTCLELIRITTQNLEGLFSDESIVTDLTLRP